MEHLPTEILLVIFNNLDINDLVNTVSHVCERWRRIIAQDSVRQNKITAVITAYTQSGWKIDRNQFKVNNVLDQGDLKLLNHCKTLEIRLTVNPLTPCTFHYFPALVHSSMFRQIHTLNVSVVTDQTTCSHTPTAICSDFDMRDIIEVINLYPDLEHLMLNIHFISKKDAVRLIDILQMKEKLKFVEITMAIPLTNRIRSNNEYIEPMNLNKLFYLANIPLKIKASYMLQELYHNNVDADYNPIDYDSGIPNLGFM
ncbi:hypothetical protein WDU94_005207 [Cyamophila willieti]